ncbi:SDR family oxidoreductase [Saccharothrix australiensis]|uniref:SDR family oxidoreductase n=1 Tax=Saccharothrix australiensis TaxID=2072 RepID=UPI001FEA2E62|nr:NAD(P)H-binding protein [Saccharothrix australiensis]
MTGATGNVGRQVVRQLADAGVAARALTRRPGAVFPPGTEVVAGDQFSPEAVRAATDGADAAFLVWPSPDARAARAVVEVMAARVGRIVFLSSGAVDDRLAEQVQPIARYHAEVERAITGAGVEWTFLRAHGFAANTLHWAPQIRAGDVVRGAYGRAAATLVHEADLAAVAVRALLDGTHHGRKYEVTGPELLTNIERVRAIGEAIGRPLRWQEVSRAEARARHWLPASLVDVVLDVEAAMVDHPFPPTSAVAEVTSAPARTFREWLADHREDFR